MPDKKLFTVSWSAYSLENAASIKHYLLENFGDHELEVFYELLISFEKAVAVFPNLYPKSNFKSRIRRAVLSKAVSAYYRVSKNKIEILAILDNRCDLNKWL
jgi:plasmid stabilization system protein ParE